MPHTASIDPVLAENLRAVMREKGRTAYSVAQAIGVSPNWLYRIINMDRGIQIPTLRKVAEELEVSIGELLETSTPAVARSGSPAVSVNDGGYPVPEKHANIDTLIAAETTPPYEVNSYEDGPEETIEQLTEVAAAAGIGASTYDETVTAKVPFRSSWLRRNRINPRHCQIIGVRGTSMEPTLPDGCSIIVDQNRLELRDGRIYVMRTEEGLVVKRTKLNAQGWWLMSDNPAWPPLFLTEETDVIGEVRWAARTF